MQLMGWWRFADYYLISPLTKSGLSLFSVVWQFLVGVLSAMETSGACNSAAASHKSTNPWFKGFDLVYGGVATDCSVPTGKNRYHKFKDKIVELWVAMETQAPDDHPLKARSMEQLTSYRKACEEANRKETTKPPPKSASTPGTPGTPARGSSASNKRSYASTYTGAPLRWKNLDEASALKALPEPLQSLVHLRNLGSEVLVGKKIEEVEEHYQTALEDYCKESSEDKDVLYSKSLALASLSRQTQNANESKTISEAYEKTVKDYVVQIDPSAAVV